MIYSVQGDIVLLKEYENFFVVCLKCAIGITLKIKVSSETAGKLKNGDNVNLYTHLILRESSLELIGFYSLEEKQLFKMLIGVSGIGSNSALVILSFFKKEKLFEYIYNSDDIAICRCKGIGKKTAQRLILELKDKIKSCFKDNFKKSDNSNFKQNEKILNEAVEALVVLGYGKNEALRAVAEQKERESLEVIIKNSLLILSRI